MSPLSHKRVFWLIIVLAAALSAGTSLFIGLQQSVWFDEAYSILLAQHSWGEIVRLTAADVHPPVYYWLLKVWMSLFGSSELALRSMSALFFALSIGFMGLLIRRLFGVKAALMTLPFLVFAPFLLRYGFEIRMYSLVSFIGVAGTYVLVMAVDEKNKQKRRLLFAGYAFLVALGVYTLYFTALIWIAHVAWLGWLVLKEKRKDIVAPGMAAYAFAFMLFVPWLPVFLGKAGGGTLSNVTHELGLKNLYGILTFLFLYQPPWKVIGLSAAAIILIIGAIIYLGIIGYKKASKKERRSLMLFTSYILVPILVLVVVTWFLPIYIERYVAHIAIAVYASIGVLIALALRDSEKRLVTIATSSGLLSVLIVGCISLAQFGNYNFQRVHTPTMKQAAGQLGNCKDGAIVFAEGPQAAMELMYYETKCPVYFFNETLEMGGGFAMLSGSPLRVADAAELPKTTEILYVYYDKPKRNIPAAFYESRVTTFGAVSVASYRADTRPL